MKQINPKKASAVSAIKDLLSRSKSVAIVDYTGLKVSQATQLRQAVKAAGGQLLVTKNTLFSIAAGLSKHDLSGTNAFIFALTDETSPLKAVADFSKKNSILTFKLGLLGDRVLTAVEIRDLALLPDRTTNSQLLTSSLKSPLYHLIYNLNWPIKRLVLSVKGLTLKDRP